MRKVIITGASGLIGSHLVVELLKSGDYDVTAMVRSEKSLSKLYEIISRHGFSDVNHLLVDTLDYEQLKSTIAEFDVVFHCAAIVSFDGNSTEEIVSNNVELTHFIVESCLASTRKPLLVHISSIAALGTETYPELTTEKTLFTNIAESSGYSRSKFLSENEVWRAAKCGLKAVVVLPSVVLGSGAKGSEGLQPVFRMAEKGIPFYTEGIVGFVDVVDVVRAMRLLSENPESWGDKYILSGYNLTYRELITALNSAYGHKAPRFKVSKGLLKFAVIILRLFQKKPLITSEMVSFLTNKTAYDGTLIERTVNLSYTPILETADRIASESKES